MFLGICNNDYAHTLGPAGVEAIDAYTGTGTTPSTAAGRLSYILGFQGPCLTLDTACSSSLVALDPAVKHLRKGGCDEALVGRRQPAADRRTARSSCARSGPWRPTAAARPSTTPPSGYGRGKAAASSSSSGWPMPQRDGDRIQALLARRRRSITTAAATA